MTRRKFFLFAAIVVVFLIPFLSKQSLLDYALTLEDGMYICDNGSLWKQADNFGDGALLVESVERPEWWRFFKHNFLRSADKLLPHEFALTISSNQHLLIANDGTIWHSEREMDSSEHERAIIFPFMTPSPIDETQAEQLPGPVPKLTGMNAPYRRLYLTTKDTPYDTAVLYVSVLLADGNWYRAERIFLPLSDLTERWLSLPSNPRNSHIPEGRYRLEVYDCRGSEETTPRALLEFTLQRRHKTYYITAEDGTRLQSTD